MGEVFGFKGTAKDMMESGKKIFLMGKDFTSGLISPSIRVVTKMVKRTDKAHILGQMGMNIKACGRMV